MFFIEKGTTIQKSDFSSIGNFYQATLSDRILNGEENAGCTGESFFRSPPDPDFLRGLVRRSAEIRELKLSNI
ncbi:hypothetical protein [Paenibacillus konkukensis]|uniref:hypothetical protein n=1 Tax=Paenibacillus konkukensis TaxID=2020716 RepID=UPI00201D3D60|nr:hypothetical protein [Paenibacillus konkukensis]